MHRFDNAHQIAFHQGNASAFDRDIGPRSPSQFPTSAAASAGASLIPSPAIATIAPLAFNLLTISIFSSGITSRGTHQSPTRAQPIRRAPIVAGAHDDFQAHVVKRANRRSGRRLDGISDAKDSDCLSI
jgi:hypothetical protein